MSLILNGAIVERWQIFSCLKTEDLTAYSVQCRDLLPDTRKLPSRKEGSPGQGLGENVSVA